MKLMAFAALATLTLTACQKIPESAAPVGAGGFNVETLFTHEGCTVYRFFDGRTIYYSSCSGSAQWSETCGKNCTRPIDVPTQRHGVSK